MPLDMSAISRRVRQLRNSLGMTQAAFGRLVGVDQGTVSRWESGQQIPEGESLFRLAGLAKVPAEEFLGTSELKPTHVINVSVIGRVQGGEWVEALAWPHEDQYEIAVPPHPKYRTFKRFALEVGGPSMDRVYPEGTILICVSFADLGRSPEPGERVIIERRSANDLVEVTVKEFVPDEAGRVWLWPRSNHPQHQQPIPLPEPGDANGTDDVRIIAKVIGRYMNE